MAGEIEHAPDPGSPEAWGWHAEFGKYARLGGWVVAAILLVTITTTHYNGAGTLALILFTLALVGILVWDINRRRTAWRE